MCPFPRWPSWLTCLQPGWPSWMGASLVASAFLAVVLCFVLLGMVDLRFSALPRRRVSLPLGRQDVEGQKTGGVKPDVDHHSVATSISALWWSWPPPPLKAG